MTLIEQCTKRKPITCQSKGSIMTFENNWLNIGKLALLIKKSNLLFLKAYMLNILSKNNI